MALKRISINTVEAPKAKKNDKPTFEITGDDAVKVVRFKAAKQAFDTAEAELKSLKKDLTAIALPKLVGHNVANAGAPTSSIKLASGDSKVTFIFQDKYPAVNADVAEQIFGDNVNDYVFEVSKVSFDASVFNKSVDGTTEFQDEVYAAFTAKVAAAATELGIQNPLSVKTLVQPKPEFHTQRWTKFDVEENLEIQEAIPATCYPRN